VASFKDDVQSCLPPVGSDFDGVVCGSSLCALSNGRRLVSNRDFVMQGVLTVWDDKMSGDVDGVDLFHTVLGEREGSCLSL